MNEREPSQDQHQCRCHQRPGRFRRFLAVIMSRHFWKRAFTASLYIAGIVAVINDLVIIVGRTLAPHFFEGARTVILEKVFSNFSTFFGG